MSSSDVYRKLQKHIDSNMPLAFPETESGVELRILKQLFTPEEAEIALELSAMPEPVNRIHKRLKNKISLEELEKKLNQLEEKGVSEYILNHSDLNDSEIVKFIFYNCGKKIVPHLIKILETTKDESAIYIILEIFYLFKDRGTLKSVIKFTNHKNFKIRQSSYFLISFIPDKIALNTLARGIFKKDDKSILRANIIALSKIDDPESCKILIDGYYFRP